MLSLKGATVDSSYPFLGRGPWALYHQVSPPKGPQIFTVSVLKSPGFQNRYQIKTKLDSMAACGLNLQLPGLVLAKFVCFFFFFFKFIYYV